MMRKLIPALLLVTAGAAQANNLGDRSCGTWLAHRTGNVTSDTLMEEAWTMGYIQAIYDFAGASNLTLRNMDGAGMFAWTDQYCREHPLDTIHLATTKLGAELMKKEQP